MVEASITPAMARHIEIWPTDRLAPYAKNARTHSPEQVAQIAASIAEFGFVNPILVGSDSVIVAGHARALAARQLGLTDVPVIILDHLTPTQRRALVIADNRLALSAGWDEEMLHLELAALREEDFDLDLLGFDDDELAALLTAEETIEGLTDEDAAPERPQTPVTIRGDLWVLGEHRLLCGDSTKAEDVLRVLGGEQTALLSTDPPYCVDYTGNDRPIHEAFAEPVLYDPKPAPVVPKAPPAPITELPPEQKPEGPNVQWIPGYWAWDEDYGDYYWVPGTWVEPPQVGYLWTPAYWGWGGGL